MVTGEDGILMVTAVRHAEVVNNTDRVYATIPFLLMMDYNV